MRTSVAWGSKAGSERADASRNTFAGGAFGRRLDGEDGGGAVPNKPPAAGSTPSHTPGTSTRMDKVWM